MEALGVRPEIARVDKGDYLAALFRAMKVKRNETLGCSRIHSSWQMVDQA